MDKAYRIISLLYSENPSFDFDPDGAVVQYLQEHYPYWDFPISGSMVTLDVEELERVLHEHPPSPEVGKVLLSDMAKARIDGAADVTYIRL